MNNAHINNGEAFWTGTFYWGGQAEATAKACKVLYDSKIHLINKQSELDEVGNGVLFHKGLSYLSSKLKNSRLYSTSDTSALIDLFMHVYERKNSPIALIDGKECRIKGRMNGKKITVQSGTALVSVKKREELNVLDIKADNLDFDIAINKMNLKLTGKLVLSITVKEDIKCPVVSIYLPPVLCSLSHGVRVQSIVAPILYNDISFEFIGVKKGTGKLYVLVYDMYEEDRRGYYCGDVTVQERKQGYTFSDSKKKRPGKKGGSGLSEI